MTGVLAIVGAGGHGRVLADAALEAGWRDVFFFDERHPSLVLNEGWPVVGALPDLLSAPARFDGVAIGIGDGRTRMRILDRLLDVGLNLVTIVHPRAWVSSRAELEAGTLVSAGAVVNTGARIARGCIVNTGATVDHDCLLAPGVHVAPGAHVSGGVEIGSCSWIGVGASVRQKTRIGTDVIVGAGAVVVSDIPDGVVAVGVPARCREKKQC